MEELGVGLIGAGRMGCIHADVLSRLVPTAKIVVIADNDLQRADKLAKSLGNVRDAPDTCDTIASVVRREDIQVCVVATPTSTHGGIVESLLSAGINVFCEKPLSLDPDESLELNSLAERLHLCLMVGFYRRFSPPFIAVRDAIRSNVLGHTVHLNIAQWDASPPSEAFLGSDGGIAVDCGVHEFDMIEWWTQERIVDFDVDAMPTVAESVSRVGDLDNLVIRARLDSGAVATIGLSRNCRYADDVRAEVLMTEGAILLRTIPAVSVMAGDSSGLREIPIAAGDAFESGIAGELKAMMNSISQGRGPDFPDGSDSARATYLALKVQRAAVQSVKQPSVT